MEEGLRIRIHLEDQSLPAVQAFLSVAFGFCLGFAASSYAAAPRIGRILL